MLNYQDLVHQFSTNPPSQQWRIKFSWSNLDPVPFMNITFLALHIAKHIGNYCKLKLLKILSAIEWLVILVGFKIHNKILEICSCIRKYIVDLLIVNNPGLSKKSNRLKAGKLCRPSDYFLGWQMPSWGVWEVSKTKMSCKEAGSVQYKAHCMWGPPHVPQQIKVSSWSSVSNSCINWYSKICSKFGQK